MAKRSIITKENPLLRKKCKEVTKFDDSLAMLLDDMTETMFHADGAGLAAPQVGILRRIFVISVDGLTCEFINPVMVKQEGAIVGQEACLSVPKEYGYVERPKTVTVRAQNRNGEPFEITVSNYAARVICHEYDHLDGILYIDKLTDKKEK